MMTSSLLVVASQLGDETEGLTGILLDFSRGGAEWVLWLLVVLSLLSIAVMVERIIFYASHTVDAQTLRLRLVELLDDGRVDEALGKLHETDSMETHVLAYGLQNAHRGRDAVEELMAGAMAKEKVRYDRYLGFLATVGNNAPFIGLFGTVLGVIQAFDGLRAVDMGNTAAAGAAVMGPIAEALVATGVGLVVAIPAVVAFNTFRTRVKKVASNAELLARTVLAHLGQVDHPPKPTQSAVAGKPHVDDALYDRVSAAAARATQGSSDG